MQKLDSALEFLASVKDIDYGGCGIAAYSVFKALGSPIDFKVIMCYPTYDDPENIREYNKDLECVLKGDIPGADTCDHIVFTVYGSGPMDAHGNVLKSYMETCEVINISPKELLELINNGKWAKRFKRNIWIPRIEKELGISLKEVII